MISEYVDVLIIGAGPSGSVAAGILHKKGISCKVVEKSKFPRFVIGESLIPRCMDHFDAAGFINDIIPHNFEKKFGARFIKNDSICWFDFSKKFTEGWDWTWQLPRAEFDKVLTDSLEKRGVGIEFETTVLDVKFNGSDSLTTVQKANGAKKEIHAKFIIDASGYGRVLPNLLGLNHPSVLNDMSATFVHVKDNLRPKGIEGTRITFEVLDTEQWFWVIPFSNGLTSLGLVAPSGFTDSIQLENPEATFRGIIQKSKFYKDRFIHSEFTFEPKTIRSYSAAVKKLYGDGFALTGNSAEFLDPVFSSGVCFATESGAVAAELIAKQLNGETVNWQKDYAEHIEFGVNVFRSYIMDWYTGDLQKLFFNKEENPEVKRKICAVLAGYVWDKTNPFVSKHDRAVKAIARLLD